MHPEGEKNLLKGFVKKDLLKTSRRQTGLNTEHRNL